MPKSVPVCPLSCWVSPCRRRSAPRCRRSWPPRRRRTATGWRVDVTIRHPDTGWDHYADGWEVLAPDGSRLGFRELVHPHVAEQPFTRSLSGVAIPAGTDYLLIRPRCLVDGWGAAAFRLDLPG